MPRTSGQWPHYVSSSVDAETYHWLQQIVTDEKTSTSAILRRILAGVKQEDDADHDL